MCVQPGGWLARASLESAAENSRRSESWLFAGYPLSPWRLSTNGFDGPERSMRIRSNEPAPDQRSVRPALDYPSLEEVRSQQGDRLADAIVRNSRVDMVNQVTIARVPQISEPSEPPSA